MKEFCFYCQNKKKKPGAFGRRVFEKCPSVTKKGEAIKTGLGQLSLPRELEQVRFIYLGKIFSIGTVVALVEFTEKFW